MVIVKRILWGIGVALLLVFSAPATAQNELPRDTVMDDGELRTLKEINRGPKRALLWSIIPGGGQVYNRAWWKVPLVYGGLLGAIAVADFNQTQYTRYVNALEARCLGDGNIIEIPNAECIPKESEFPVGRFSTPQLVSARNNANKQRQTAYFGILAVYILQAVEAFTDAHLKDFDISDDLSIRLSPEVSPSGMVGAGLVVPLGSGKRRAMEVARVRNLSR
jgi:hypothetical protein